MLGPLITTSEYRQTSDASQRNKNKTGPISSTYDVSLGADLGFRFFGPIKVITYLPTYLREQAVI